MADTVQHIKDKLSIEDVVGQYIKLERAGSSLRARCPFHAERTPSFHVSPDRGTYHCFGCGAGGDIFTFVEQIEGLDFKGALKLLAEKAGVPLTWERGQKTEGRDRLYELLETATIQAMRSLADTPAALAYLENERGLQAATIRALRLGFSGAGWSDMTDHLKAKGFSEREVLDAGIAKRGEQGRVYDRFRNRVLFPIADSAGRVVGFSGRLLSSESEPEAPKYLNSPETPLFQKSRILYGFDRAKMSIRTSGCAVLVEGQMDLAMAHQAGWANTVATSGTAFSPEHATLLRRLTENLVIALDADEAGFKAAVRAAHVALKAGLNVKIAEIRGGKDPADVLREGGKEAWSALVREAQDILAFLLDALERRAASSGEDAPLARERFRRLVERIVLPFLYDVESPIAREQYVRDIAARLGVSEASVSAAWEKMPRAPSEGDAREPIAPVSDALGRGEQAFALLLWQEARKEKDIDAAAFARELEDAVGAAPFKRLRSLPEEEHERLRFSAERLFAKARIKEESATLLHLVRRERLTKELDTLTIELKEAERAGDEQRVAALTAECALRTREIAGLSPIG